MHTRRSLGGAWGMRGQGGWIGTTGEHVSLDWMRRAFRALYNQNEKTQKFRFKANQNLRDVVKNQNQRMTPKINMNINHVHK